jgi:integrase
MTRTLTLPIKEAVAFAKVNKFLNSKARNSESTKKSYSIALSHFQFFLRNSTQHNIETVLVPLEKKQIDVYNLLDEFIDYLRNRKDVYNGDTKLSEKTIAFYIAGVKSYLEYFDIEISAKKLRNKVTMPKIYRRKKEILNQKKIRNMLLACNNDRLKVFILVLASGGTRSMETLSIRNRDIDFEEPPTKLHIIAENTKTKQDRDVYISDEAFRELKKFVETKYNDNLKSIKSSHPNDLVFSSWKTEKIQPRGIYGVLHKQFASLLRKIEMAQRKDGQGIQRRKISFHLFRDYVKSTVSKHTTKDFSEWLLGHTGSTYWNLEEDETKELYLKCMKYLIFLDYDVVETVGADFESKLREKDQEIVNLNRKVQEIENRLLDMDPTKLLIKQLRRSKQRGDLTIIPPKGNIKKLKNPKKQ